MCAATYPEVAIATPAPEIPKMFDLRDTENMLWVARAAGAVVEFALDGSVRWADDYFLKAPEFSAGGIQDGHRRTFVDRAACQPRGGIPGPLPRM